MTGRQARRRKQILDDLKEMTGYWKLKQEALYRNVCRTRFGRGCGTVVRQSAEWMDMRNCVIGWRTTFRDCVTIYLSIYLSTKHV